MKSKQEQNLHKDHHARIWICTFLAICAIVAATVGWLCTDTNETFASEFLFPFSLAFSALTPTYFAIDTVGSKWLEQIKERVDYGINNKKILLAGDRAECENVEAQLRYSQVFNKDNITNISTEVTHEAQSYDETKFAQYDLVILCFTGPNNNTLKDNQAQLLSNVLSTIGDDTTIKRDMQAVNQAGTVVGLIVLCPLQSLKGPKEFENADRQKIHSQDTAPFTRPFTVVVNQAGRLLTDVFSLLTTLPPRNDH